MCSICPTTWQNVLKTSSSKRPQWQTWYIWNYKSDARLLNTKLAFTWHLWKLNAEAMFFQPQWCNKPKKKNKRNFYFFYFFNSLFSNTLYFGLHSRSQMCVWLKTWRQSLWPTANKTVVCSLPLNRSGSLFETNKISVGRWDHRCFVVYMCGNPVS